MRRLAPLLSPDAVVAPEGPEPVGALSGDGGAVPARAPGIEVVGRFRGSGYKERRYLVRRADGSWIELSRILYWVLVAVDGRRSVADIARNVGDQIERDVSDENVELLLGKLAGLGLLATGPGDVRAPDLALGMRVRRSWIPARVVRGIAGSLTALFHLPVIFLVVVGFVYVNVRLLGAQRTLEATNEVLRHPTQGLAVIALVLAGALFHEFGHATACAFGGAQPGAIGGGFVLMWPAMYTDVTDCYRLRRSGRVRTDLGGVYFNAVFGIIVGVAFLATGYAPLLLVVLMTNLMMIEQLMPFVRFDGYWALSDLAGVPDLFPQLQASLVRLVPFRRSRGAPEVLKPRSRRIITTWALVTAVALPIQFGMMLVLAPSIAVSTSMMIETRFGAVTADVSAERYASGLLQIVHVLVATMFVIGLIYAVCFLTYRIVRAVVRQLGGSPVRRLTIAVASSAVVLAPVAWSASQIRITSTT
jgi:putative peptide zinc metalloprotease protein